MARQNINIGTSANSGTGDPLRTAFTKANENFVELYTAVGTIPTNTNQLTNGSGFITVSDLPRIPADVSDLTDTQGLLGGGGSSDRLVNGEYQVVLNSDGDLTLPIDGDLLIGEDGRWIKNCGNSSGVTSMRWINVPVDSDSTQLLRIYSGDPDGEGSSAERAQLRMDWLDEDRSGLTIRTFDRSDEEDTVRHNWQFQGDGILALPAGGTIAEGVVTDNPTIELTPANFDVESQKLVIKGGGPGFSNTENGITIVTYNLTAASGNTAYFEVFSQYAGETFYWWVDNYSPGQEFFPDNGEITLSEFGYANIEFTVNDDTVPLRIYVADTLYNAYANSKGAVSVTVNGESQDSYHLHLTTGDLSETSIFLGTDELNVRTTTNGTIQITTPTEGSNVWEFGNDGRLTLPHGGDIVDRNGDSVLGGGSGDTGDITFNGADISAPNEQTIRIQAKDDDSVVRAYFRLDPDDGVAEMRAVSSRSTEYFSTSNWTTAEWTGSGGSGNIAFTDAADLISFLNNQYNRGINREFSINEGDYIEYIGFGGDDNNITLYTDVSPPADPTTVNSIEFRYRRESRIEIDYDDDEINIIGRGLDIDIETDEQIDISANGSVEISSDTSIALLNNSATNSIIIRTNNNNTNQAWEFAADGKLTLPGALVKSTVSKTGANPFANSAYFEVTSVDENGAVTEITVTNSPNPNWTTGTSGNALGDVNFTVTVDGSGNVLVTVDGGGTGHFIGETFNLSAESLGGTTPTPTELDLTKSVNKLTVGSYALADGVEGQIMYLVRQPDTDSEVEIFVANGRVGSSVYNDIAFFPFSGGSGSGNMTTLIFTDGAWQAEGGSWD